MVEARSYGGADGHADASGEEKVDAISFRCSFVLGLLAQEVECFADVAKSPALAALDMLDLGAPSSAWIAPQPDQEGSIHARHCRSL